MSLSAPAGTAQSITYSLDGGETVAGTVTFAAGATTATITVPTISDGIFGSDAGAVTVTLANGASDTIDLTDAEANTPPVFSISGNADAVVEGQTAVFTVSLSAPAGTAQSITYSLDGGETVAGTVTIAAGATTATITVPTISDGVFGSDAGAVTVTLANGASDTIDLTDAEANTPPVFSISGNAVAVVEGQNAVFTVNLSAPAGTAQSITYSLDGGETVAGTVTIAAGATTATITVPTISDGVFGSDAGAVR